MASTTAMFTALSGLNANARQLDIIGNNISNVNTTAYKSTRMLFAPAFSQTISSGSAPSDESGGTNPRQIGLGVNISGTLRDFRGGSLSNTADQRDLAIEGEGFFIVRQAESTYYTRAGAFRQNSVNDLVTISGENLQGYAVDDQFNLVTDRLVDLNLAVGEMTLVQATRNADFSGNLNAAGPLPTRGSRHALDALAVIGAPIGGPALETTSLLTQIDDSLSPGNALFSAGQTIELNSSGIGGAEKGTRRLPTASLQITNASTVADLLAFFEAAFAIRTDLDPNPDGQPPGASLDPATGVISIVGNTGTVNDIDFQNSDIVLRSAAGDVLRQPFVPTKSQDADGESVRGSLIAYDSLGSPVSLDVTAVLHARTATGNQWRYDVESPDDSDNDARIATGILSFDLNGVLTSPTSVNVQINRENTGALDPLTFALNFAGDEFAVTSRASTNSSLIAQTQDGAPLGTLAAFGIGPDGVITGAFTNSLTRTIGQIPIATFSNPEGLLDEGGSLFIPGPNSGPPVVATAGDQGSGQVVSGALELSNVDLAQEFINLILASTGYSASSRVISTADELIQQLLVIGR